MANTQPYINAVESCTPAQWISASLSPKPVPDIDFPAKWVDTVTGRAALVHILRYFEKTGVFASPLTEFLVPKWLCQSVVQLMRKYCAPTLDITAPSKAALIFHQFGFPQDMKRILSICADRNMIVIEDCANLFEGYYHGQRLGTFGFAAIFSFWKLFPSVWGGGLATSSQDLYEFAQSEKQKLHNPLASQLLYLNKFLIDRNAATPNQGLTTTLEMLYAHAEECQYPLRASKVIVGRSIAADAMKTRRRNYLYLHDVLSSFGIMDSLEKDGVFPYVVPLVVDAAKRQKMTARLNEINCWTTINQFDCNRNIFEPNYQAAQLIPCHQGLSLDDMDRICRAVKGAL